MSFFDKPSVEPRNSVKLSGYVLDSYRESFDMIHEDDEDESVINLEKGETSEQLAYIADDGELTFGKQNAEGSPEEEGEEDMRRMPSHDVINHDADHNGGYGFVYTARLVPDDYNDKKHCLPNGDLKGRRPMPQAWASDFLSKVSQTEEGKWIYSGVLNEWPALTSLEVLSMEYVYKTRGGVFSKTYWRANKQGKKEKPYYPKAGMAFFMKQPRSVRVKVREPSYSRIGYSKRSPGFLFWYKMGLNREDPRMAHGSNAVAAARSLGERNVCVAAHHFSHRYAVGARRETFKESISYHTGVLLEWDHGKFCTVVELAWLGGLGGYGGKSNWYDDRDSPNPKLYDVMPSVLKKPWRTNMSEIRVLDVEAKNLKEFKAFMKKYEGKRFVKPAIDHSGPVRLSFREEEHILQYCLNYIQRDTVYSETSRNCQTFAADFIGFLLAKGSIKPTKTPMVYHDRKHLFLYDAVMFDGARKQPAFKDVVNADGASKKKDRESLTTRAKNKLMLRKKK